MKTTQKATLDEIIQKLGVLDSVWERCRQNLLFGFSSWALWEVLNGYPTRTRIEPMFEALKSFQLPLPLFVLKQQLVLSSMIPLGRLVDPVVNARGKDREAIEQIRAFWEEQSTFAFFADTNEVRRFCGYVNIDENLWNSRFAALKLRLDGHSRSLTAIRPHIKKFRDDWLAHSLKNPAPSEVSVFAIRDAFVLVAYILEEWAFLFYGRNWSSKDLAQREFDQAKAFWEVFARGLKMNTGRLESK